MKITKAIVIRFKEGPDHVGLITDLTDATFPHLEKLQLKFEAARGTGDEYVFKNFPGVPIELLTT